MPLQTTMIGSYPKPEYVPMVDSFKNKDLAAVVNANSRKLDGQSVEKLLEKAERQVIEEQCELGISIITDGEIRRETYYFPFCRNTKGFDVEHLEEISLRNGACRLASPVIVDRIESCGATFAWQEWQAAQALSNRPVKYTLPGPMTVFTSVLNKFYNKEQDASEDLIKVINREILDLVKHGCKHIQLDEPVFVRDTTRVMKFGIKNAERCFQGVPSDVQKTIHICRGYPLYLDQVDYPKADPNCYEMIASELENSIFDLISLEDATHYNDLALFEKFKKKTVVVGVVKIASSKIESVEQIRTRVEEILTVLPKERLVLSPDCGVGFLADDTVRKTKLRNMIQVANEI